jgi:hypothetical protein
MPCLKSLCRFAVVSTSKQNVGEPQLSHNTVAKNNRSLADMRPSFCFHKAPPPLPGNDISNFKYAHESLCLPLGYAAAASLKDFFGVGSFLCDVEISRQGTYLRRCLSLFLYFWETLGSIVLY